MKNLKIFLISKLIFIYKKRIRIVLNIINIKMSKTKDFSFIKFVQEYSCLLLNWDKIKAGDR